LKRSCQLDSADNGEGNRFGASPHQAPAMAMHLLSVLARALPPRARPSLARTPSTATTRERCISGGPRYETSRAPHRRSRLGGAEAEAHPVDLVSGPR
jgi:hypothetical protein